ncbi:CRISPR-associated protein Cas5 [Propionispora hippei]|uniref:CRISPR-associated protein, Cas5h family n=1 Tax=Propionispora hippei DSM 15287 TaxID=1123003 RepID=A0A1M6KUE4_9FIRM|nr:CRISPR-associated protein Cas5 [Propionispora hippei]SHJ62490.1 CRISPR-associated protein, Cas5h family [Propionispora hippei DSM 15287]
MRGIAFDVRGSVAHFRRPDTTATQLTYPFITPTAAKGLVGAILGIEDFVTADQVGIELLHPVQTVAQQMSMLGKDPGLTFNRPTTVELLVNPAYRIYYTGEENTEVLIKALTEEQTVYATYLGVAYALTRPVLHKVYSKVEFVMSTGRGIESKTVVPTAMIERLIVQPDRYYCRAGGYLRQYRGNRRFEQSVDFLYEKDGKPISFVSGEIEIDVQLATFGEDWICLV